jgi:hypothetical protein
MDRAAGRTYHGSVSEQPATEHAGRKKSPATLTPRLKNAPLRDKLEGIFHELDGPIASWEGRKVWRDLLLVNEARNFIAHQKK